MGHILFKLKNPQYSEISWKGVSILYYCVQWGSDLFADMLLSVTVKKNNIMYFQYKE
jgi:hypothetical protein